MPLALRLALLLALGLLIPLYGYAMSTSTLQGAMQGNERWTVFPSLIELKVGEQQQITFMQKKDIPYTPVLGWDNPAIGTLTAQGLFTAHFPGQGLITITAGNHRKHIYVKVIE